MTLGLALGMASALRLQAPVPTSAGISFCDTLERPIANDDPTTPGDAAYQTPEDVPWDESFETYVLANDVCVEGLTSLSDSNAFGGSFDFDDGDLEYFPNANFAGNATTDYSFTSPYGTSNVARVTIQVLPVNDRPSIQSTTPFACSSISRAEDSGAFETLCKWAGDPGGMGTESGQQLTGHASTSKPDLFSAGPTFVLESTLDGGPLRFTPNADAFGTATVELWVEDDGGTARGGVDESVHVEIEVTIEAVDDAPVAKDDTYSTSIGQQLVVPAAGGLLKNDTDIDGPARTASKLSGPAHGVASVQADGSFTYTPQAGYSGPDTFAYRATSGALHDDATVKLTILGAGATPPPTQRPSGTKAPSGTAIPAGTVAPASAGPSAPAASAVAETAAPTAPAPSGPPASSPVGTAAPIGTEPSVAPVAPTGGTDQSLWLLLAIVVVVVVGLNVGLYQYVRSRRAQAGSGPTPASGT